jgi:hypothetical protein
MDFRHDPRRVIEGAADVTHIAPIDDNRIIADPSNGQVQRCRTLPLPKTRGTSFGVHRASGTATTSPKAEPVCRWQSVQRQACIHRGGIATV